MKEKTRVLSYYSFLAMEGLPISIDDTIRPLLKSALMRTTRIYQSPMKTEKEHAKSQVLSNQFTELTVETVRLLRNNTPTALAERRELNAKASAWMTHSRTPITKLAELPLPPDGTAPGEYETVNGNIITSQYSDIHLLCLW